ncbi:phage tail protein [Kitasatospora sp. NPDC058048]|uniref:phage tail protein n=1 Tax=Kitasatospora sp. NPDC058048 TaxID=3346313 RepID=UPI0036DA38A2
MTQPTDMLVSYVFGIEMGNFHIETVQSVSAVTYGQDVTEARYVTATGELVIHKQPGARQAGEVTVTRGMDRNTAFTDWVKQSLDNRVKKARQNITISVKDPTKATVRRIHLHNAWASQWSGPALDAGSNNVATETVTLTYEDITVE